MPKPKITFFQTFKNEPMKPEYWGELFGAQLGIKDDQGDSLTFYKSDYDKFLKIIHDENLHIKTLSPRAMLQLILDHNKDAPPSNGIQLIKYFKPDTLSHFELDVTRSNFSKDGIIATQDGTVLQKNGHQNCLVMLHDGHVYVHPKVRADTKSNIVGINHSSMAKGQSVAFAGSLVHHNEQGWVIENTTGHYGTRATQMRTFLVGLEQRMVPIDQLTVKLWIPKAPDNPGIKESDYDIIMENASSFLSRTSKSIKAIDDKGYKSSPHLPIR